MGEVYRARDTKLKREVAIKVLPADVAADRERLARFQREAEVLASLNHPHIAHVYGLENPPEGGHHIVMELVEGDDLSQRIARGPIPIDEAVPIGRQIAEALEAAHNLGIIHRDLKPANIKVRDDGTVKVLDFGLAKALESAAGNREPGADSALANSPTITSPAMTQRGVILGTAAYMSPEQAKGKVVDRRTDIWAFGCVVYEMLTGRKAFDGEDVTDTIVSVMSKEPDWSKLPAGSTPAPIQRLLRRCLVKDRSNRLPDIGVARLEMTEAMADMGASMSMSEAARRPPLRIAAIAGLTAIIAVVIGWAASRYFAAPALVAADRHITRFELAVPAGYMRIASRGATMALSYDGKRLAFIAVNSTGRGSLFLREMSQIEPKLLEAATVLWASPSWSPDGRYILITAAPFGGVASPADPGRGGPVRRLDPGGGPATTVAEWGRYPIWGSAGDIVYGGRDGRVYRVPESGGASTAVTELDASVGEIAHLPSTFLPDGRRFIFMVQNQDSQKNALFVTSIESGARVPLALPGTRVVFAGGWLWFIQDGTLMAHRFDPVSARLEGGPQSVASNVADFSVSSRILAISPRDSTTMRMTWLDRQGMAAEPVADPATYTGVTTPSLSPDDSRMVFMRPDANGLLHVWQVDLERNVSTRLTSSSNQEDAAVYSPDGRYIVFSRGTGDLYRRAADGSGSDELLLASPLRQTPTDISPDGTVLVFTRDGGETGADIWALPLTGERKPRPLVVTNALEGNAQFSPDGRWLSYCAGASGESDHVYVEPFPLTGARTRLSTTNGSSPKWSADGRHIYYGTPSGQIMRVSLTTGNGSLRVSLPEAVVRAPLLFSHNAFVLDARSRILALNPENDRTRDPATVILNWPALLETTGDQ
jgi:Tol biopolymer transport system component